MNPELSQHRYLYTLLGCLALLIWSTTALINVWLRDIPAVQLLTLTFSVCFIVSLLSLTLRKRWSLVFQQPLSFSVISFLSICSSQYFFVSAFRYAPAAHVDIINYLWPMLAIVLSSLMTGHRMSWRDCVAALIGFCGVYVLLASKDSFSTACLIGYGYAFMTALSWALYTISCRGYSDAPPEMIGIYCGAGGLLTYISSGSVAFLAPTSFQWILILFIAVGVFLVSYPCWNVGVRKGNFTFLALLSYFNPLVSVMILAAFGHATLSPSLLSSCALIILSSTFSLLCDKLLLASKALRVKAFFKI